MLTVLNWRALSAWSSHGQTERRSRRICRALTTAASMRMCAPRSMLSDPSLGHSRCARAGSVRGDVLQSGDCPTVLANSNATAAAGQKPPLEAFRDRFFAQNLIIMVFLLFSLLFSLLSPPPPPPPPPFLLLPPPSSAEFLKLSHQHRKKAAAKSIAVLPMLIAQEWRAKNAPLVSSPPLATHLTHDWHALSYASRQVGFGVALICCGQALFSPYRAR